MYRKLHNGQLSIEDFHVHFGGTLDADNRWVIFSTLTLAGVASQSASGIPERGVLITGGLCL